MDGKINHVIENLVKIMNDRKLNKVSFADLVGFPEAKWNKIANGKQGLSVNELSIIAEKLQLREIDIYTFPYVYVKKEAKDTIERVSVTFDVAPENRDMLLNLVTQIKTG